MKSRIKNCLLAFLVSLEFVCILVCTILLIINVDSIYTRASEIIFNKFELSDIAIQIGIPLALLGLSYRQYHHILQPEMDLKEFYNWPDYVKLKDTFIVGLIWNAIPIVTALSIIFIFPHTKDLIKGFLYVAPLLASAISTITILFASQRIKEIVEKNKQNNPSH